MRIAMASAERPGGAALNDSAMDSGCPQPSPRPPTKDASPSSQGLTVSGIAAKETLATRNAAASIARSPQRAAIGGISRRTRKPAAPYAPMMSPISVAESPMLRE
ncbi:hypothetical protein D3C83_26100 [compost metagenome]